MDTVATIPTGAMAERWKWNSFIGWGLFCGAIYYPLFAAWTWGGGWLAKTWDTMSLAPATWTSPALASCTWSVVPPRWPAPSCSAGIGRMRRTARRRAPATTSPWPCSARSSCLFGWFGFNAASTLASTDIQFAVVATNTAIAGAFGSIAAMFWIMFRTGKPDPG